VDSAIVKEKVRQRDGYRCTRCGMTNEEHQRLYRNQHGGKSLEVHRLVPGSKYTLEGCVTLCYACHQAFPKSPPAPRVNLLHQLRAAHCAGQSLPDV
jgi:5-methylcytosine-specific restriction endonuclease McrA